MARAAHPHEVIKPPVWKRIGFMLGVLLVVPAAARLWRGQTGVWLVLDVALLVFGILLMFLGWRQGVEVSPAGIRLRRLCKRRQYEWDEIADFESNGNAVLRDGSRVALLDWNVGAPELVASLRHEGERLGQLSPNP
jgi:hypothetical protein